MKEVLMLLLAMIIGFAGGTGMFALILHYCNGNEKSHFISSIISSTHFAQ